MGERLKGGGMLSAFIVPRYVFQVWEFIGTNQLKLLFFYFPFFLLLLFSRTSTSNLESFTGGSLSGRATSG